MLFYQPWFWVGSMHACMCISICWLFSYCWFVVVNDVGCSHFDMLNKLNYKSKHGSHLIFDVGYKAARWSQPWKPDKIKQKSSGAPIPYILPHPLFLKGNLLYCTFCVWSLFLSLSPLLPVSLVRFLSYLLLTYLFG